MKRKKEIKYNGGLTITNENQSKYKNLTEVSGSIDVRQDATFTAPALTEVSGSIDVRQDATFTAPALTKSGYIYVSQDATFTAPALTEVSGSIDVRQDATFTAPALTIASNQAKINNKKYNVVHFDGVMFIIEHEKTSKGVKIYKGCLNLKIQKGKIIFDVGFLAQKENFTAHGSTMKSAISDLNFKIVSEKLKHTPINKDTNISVQYYRLITGACDIGVRSWMEANNIAFKIINKGKNNEKTEAVKSMKAHDLLPLLEVTNAYGFEKLKSLITF